VAPESHRPRARAAGGGGRAGLKPRSPGGATVCPPWQSTCKSLTSTAWR